MTVFAFTALSVETSTKRFAPNSTAMSATVRVTSDSRQEKFARDEEFND